MRDQVEALLERGRRIREQAEKLDTSRTEIVPMSDLRVGDIVIAVGPAAAHRFPFPFTMSSVRVIRGCVVLTAEHGWFNLRPYPGNDPALILSRTR